MGWASGTDTWDKFAEIIHTYVPAGEVRQAVYQRVYDALCDEDWDTQDEAEILDHDMRQVWLRNGIYQAIHNEEVREVAQTLRDEGYPELADKVAGWDGAI